MKRLCMIALLIFVMLSKHQVLHASVVGEIKEFDEMKGESKYIGEKYFDNYSLDIEKTDIFDTGDKMMNSIANGFFGFFKWIAKLVCSIFYFAMKFDITDIIGKQINGIQKDMKHSIFSPLFTLACVGVSVTMIKRLIKQDVAGIISEIFKVSGLVVLSILVVNQSSTVLSNTTKITKGIATDVLVEMNHGMGVAGSNSGTSYAAESAGVLWVNLIHYPWKSLEFGTKMPDSNTIDKFLNTQDGSKERKELVKQYEEEQEGTFNKNKGTNRIGLLLAYILPFLVKCIVYIAVAVIQLIFQLLALFYVLLAPLVLLLAMLPGYERMVTRWLKCILETQIGILVITVMMALMIKIDIALYNMVPQLGWYVGVILQIALSLGLFFGRNKILNMFINVQKSVGNPRHMEMQMRRMGNPYAKLSYMKSSVNQMNRNMANYRKIHDDRVQFLPMKKKQVMHSDEKAQRKKPEGAKSSTVKTSRQNREVTQEYIATPTQYNQVDTSDLHSIWENAVPKEKLVQDESNPKQENSENKDSVKVENKRENAPKNKPLRARPTTKSYSEKNRVSNKDKRSQVNKTKQLKKARTVERPVSYQSQASDITVNTTLADSKSTIRLNSNLEDKKVRPIAKSKDSKKANEGKEERRTLPVQETSALGGYMSERPIMLNGKPIERPNINSMDKDTSKSKKLAMSEKRKKSKQKKVKEQGNSKKTKIS